MATVPYVVQTGDFLLKLAVRYGFEADTVWNLPENADLKKRRPNPNILCSGDVLYIPEEKRTWLPVTTGSSNAYTATVPTVSVSATFSKGGKPLANATCIVAGVPSLTTATTDGSGLLKLEVPVTTEIVVVKFPDVPLVRQLCIGHLDPVDELTGVVQRLRNLRYISPHTSIDLEDPEALSKPVSAFQKDQKLEVTGAIDSSFEDALKTAHGC